MLICLRKRVVNGVSHIAFVYVGKKTVVNSIVLLRSSLLKYITKKMNLYEINSFVSNSNAPCFAPATLCYNLFLSLRH